MKALSAGFEKYKHPFREELVALELNSFKLWMESEVKFNILSNSIPIEDLQNFVRKEALSRGCDHHQATLIAERWRALAQRALSILNEAPERVWDSDFRRLIAAK